ncbi:MAG: FHA domain-containing protein [Proteobacteria bacterium]|nr:FHA domain-containing protein [Pseudomonadota bacterium]
MTRTPLSTASPLPLVLQLRLHNEVDGQTRELTFERWPVRIGRNSANELVLDHPYVSQWHAAIGVGAGGATITQVSSTNSVLVDGRKLAAGEEVTLTGTELVRVVPFSLQLRVVALPVVAAAQVPGSAPTPVVAGFAPGAMPGPPPPLGAPALGAATGALQLSALHVLDSLAQRLLGRSLDDPQQVLAFGARLDQLLDVFLRCLIALRRGQDQFRHMLDLRAIEAPGDELLQRGDDPEALGRSLFELGRDTVPALEQAFKSIMLHEVGLLNGMVAGLRHLLDRLSPETIRQEAGKSQRTLGPKQLWETFEAIHRDLAEEDNATFEAIFGRPFDRAYASLANDEPRR